ncbi:MAG TPA: cupredoxin domain-containing protein [bacterium]|nr:cupredoxin domain-containing protein [bacterium]
MSKSKRARPHAIWRRERASRARAIWFGIAAAAVLGAAVYLATAPFRPPAAAPAPGAEGRPVVVSMAGFEPPNLRVSAARDVVLTFINPDSQFHVDGGGWHQFRIETLNVDVRIAPRSQKTVNLGRIPPGTYVFYCDLCCGGKENPSMRGTLEVTG